MDNGGEGSRHVKGDGNKAAVPSLLKKACFPMLKR